MLRRYIFIIAMIGLMSASLPKSTYAQGYYNFNEWMNAELPVWNTSVANATDYYVYIRSEYLNPHYKTSVVSSDWLALYPGSSNDNNFMQVGYENFSNTTRWFVSVNPLPNGSPPSFVCLRGTYEFPVNGTYRGCLGADGDVGLGHQLWGRFQFVTYGQGYWIARVRNDATGVSFDLARIYLASTTIARATVSMEESWMGQHPVDNPWINAGFYNSDAKYRTGAYWAEWPSNIGGNYGAIQVFPASNSSAVVCPDHYRVLPYIGGSPYLWYAGIGMSNVMCNGILYNGGGPNTAVTSIVGVSNNKLMSSNNGTGCVTTNKSVDSPFEQWSVKDQGGNIMVYGGNNAGKYMSRRSNNELWTEGTNINDNNVRYYFSLFSIDGKFSLKNLGNNLYVNHHSGVGCTKPDTATQPIDTLFRYVAM